MAVQLNAKGLYILSADTDITESLVKEYIQDYDGKKSAFAENYDMYIGNHEILKAKKADYKPNNRLVVNFAKYIVDTQDGYFIGIPAKESHPDDAVNLFMQNFINENDLQDNEAEISKMCSIYGRGFELLYQNSHAETKATYLSPLEGFMVYDDTIEETPLFFVRYYYDSDRNLHYTVYDRKQQWSNSGDVKQHYFGGVPVIEYIQNEERQGAFDNVKTLINALNKALSEKANDVDYFADAYLKVIGADLDEESLQQLRDSRVINLKDNPTDGTVVIEFLDKPNSDETQEHLIDRLKDFIYQMAMVVNVSDETFGNAPSGVALEQKLLSMKNAIGMKSRKFQAGLRRRWQLVFNVNAKTGKVKADAWKDIEYKFTLNIPQNIASEAEAMQKLEGVVSKKTQLSIASFVADPAAEMEQMEKEQQDNINSTLRQTDEFLRKQTVNEDE